MNVHYLNLPAAQYVCRVLGFELEVIFFPEKVQPESQNI